jgi:hypothetical protein
VKHDTQLLQERALCRNNKLIKLRTLIFEVRDKIEGLNKKLLTNQKFNNLINAQKLLQSSEKVKSWRTKKNKPMWLKH